MKIGFYAGSFDPFTNGHLHIIKKSSELFDKVIVGVTDNSSKSRRFDKELIRRAIEEVLEREELKNVEVSLYTNLTVDSALDYGSNFLIRGIRNSMDYEYEENLASINEEISGLDTIYIRAGDVRNISSTMVMELIKNEKDVSKYVPKEILKLITK